MATPSINPWVARLYAEMKRCDREIETMKQRANEPAWLVTLGIEDWEMEKRLIRAELRGGCAPRRRK